MADVVSRGKLSSASARWITGRQSYRLEVRQAPSTDGLSIVSVEAVERLGEPYRITLELTSDVELNRADYLGRDATFTIEPPPDGGEVRTFNGCITRLTRTRKTRDFCAYRIVVEAHIARLRLTRATRIFQNRSVPDIIADTARDGLGLTLRYSDAGELVTVSDGAQNTIRVDYAGGRIASIHRVDVGGGGTEIRRDGLTRLDLRKISIKSVSLRETLVIR